jgi:hypothetical protein
MSDTHTATAAATVFDEQRHQRHLIDRQQSMRSTTSHRHMRTCAATSEGDLAAVAPCASSCLTASPTTARRQHSTAQHSTAQHSTAQHSTAQHSTAQHSTAQHSTAQHSTATQARHDWDGNNTHTRKPDPRCSAHRRTPRRCAQPSTSWLPCAGPCCPGPRSQSGCAPAQSRDTTSHCECARNSVQQMRRAPSPRTRENDALPVLKARPPSFPNGGCSRAARGPQR